MVKETSKKISTAELLNKIERLKNEINEYHIDFIRKSKADVELEDMIKAANRIFLSNEAKRIRAIIPLLIAEEGFCDFETVKRYGVLIELLHFASLVHDDVIDEADERRRQPTLNSLYLNSNAVLIGDHYMCESIEYALQSKHSTIIISVSMRAVKDLITGVIMEQKLANENFGYDEYSKMAQLKTGCLFGLSFGLPFAGTDKLEFGQATGVEFGTLFQIYDDYLDRTEDKGCNNIYNILSAEEISEKCQSMYKSVEKKCRKLAILPVLTQVTKYLQSYGYFFDIKVD